MYIISDQLCRASDECYPPSCFHVSFLHDRVITVDIEAERVTCRALNGDEVLQTSPPGTLGELRQKVNQVAFQVNPKGAAAGAVRPARCQGQVAPWQDGETWTA